MKNLVIKYFSHSLKALKNYVMNVYNHEYLSVQPWDGDFSMDYISTINIPYRFSIYNVCKNAFFKNQNSIKKLRNIKNHPIIK